jgi:hypothetical protein
VFRPNHDDLQCRADASEINLHGAEIPSEDPAALRANPRNHLLSEAGLLAQEPESRGVAAARRLVDLFLESEPAQAAASAATPLSTLQSAAST